MFIHIFPAFHVFKKKRFDTHNHKWIIRMTLAENIKNCQIHRALQFLNIWLKIITFLITFSTFDQRSHTKKKLYQISGTLQNEFISNLLITFLKKYFHNL